MKNKAIHIHSSKTDDNGIILPDINQTDYGELIINTSEGNETITFKNSNNEYAFISKGADIAKVTDSVLEHVDYIIDDHHTQDPHNLTKLQIGLENVQNHSDRQLELSIAFQIALKSKINKADVYNKLVETDGIDTTKVPLSASMGQVLSTAIYSQSGGLTETISDLEQRISVMEALINQ